ncbi:MAG: enoyl-CoA hydratase/isomerase family protein [Bacteroidota bacterium]
MASLEKHKNTAVLRLDNPPLNFLVQPEFIDKQTLSDFLTDESITGLIIAGVGRHFSAGAELEGLLRKAADFNFLEEEMKRGRELLALIENLDIPVIAAINGACFGGGLEIALSCHIRLCSERSLFAFPEVNHNLMPGLGGTVRLPFTAGISESIIMMLGGDTINAEKALSLGIVYAVESGDSLVAAFELMRKMTEDKPKKVITSIMRAIHNARQMSYSDALAAETQLFCELAVDEASRIVKNPIK